MILTPSERNTSSKLAVNFVSRSRIRNLNPAILFSAGTGQVPSDLGDPGAAWMLGHAQEMDSPTPQLDHELHVESPEKTVSTVRKSVARMPAAWALRNSAHEGPPLGAGPRR